MKKFIILCRYEHWDKNNKKSWCKWYVVDHQPRNLKDTIKKIEELKTRSAQTDKVTKLKHEFKALSVKDIRI